MVLINLSFLIKIFKTAVFRKNAYNTTIITVHVSSKVIVDIHQFGYNTRNINCRENLGGYGLQ